MREDAVRRHGNRISAREHRSHGAKRGDTGFVDRIGPEILGAGIAHPGERDPDRMAIAPCDVRGIRILADAHVACVCGERRGGMDPRLPLAGRNHEVIGGVDRRIVARRPMEDEGAKIERWQLRVPIAEGAPGAQKRTIVIEHQREPVEPELPATTTPEQPPPRPRRTIDVIRKNAGPGAVGIAVFAAKAKAIFATLFALKWLLFLPKFAISFLSIGASLFFYATAFGPKLGIVFILLLLMHELGHYYAFRAMGMPVSLPVFIPFVGAFVTVPQASTITRDAIGAIAGPVLGSAAALVCFAYGTITGNQFWLACAHIGFFLNLFNLAPVPPLDGGRVIAVLSPRLWLIGIVGAVAAITFTHTFSGITSLLLLVLVIAFLPRAWAAWKGKLDPAYLAVPARDRLLLGGAYFALAALLAIGMALTTPNIPTAG